MKKLITFLFVCVCFVVIAGAQSLIDTVYLKDGGVVHGTIIEEVPAVSIKIQTADGNIFVYKLSDVSKITKEPVSNGNSYKESINNGNNYYRNNGNYNQSNSSSNTKSGFDRSPFLAGFLSWVVPGIGQFYNGQAGKGVTFLLVDIASSSCVYYGAQNENDVCLYVGVGCIFFDTLISIIDASTTAHRLNIQNGYTGINLNRNTFLGIKPDFCLNTSSYTMCKSKISPSYGASISLKF
jgi:hypothetical protein